MHINFGLSVENFRDMIEITSVLHEGGGEKLYQSLMETKFSWIHIQSYSDFLVGFTYNVFPCKILSPTTPLWKSVIFIHNQCQ